MFSFSKLCHVLNFLAFKTVKPYVLMWFVLIKKNVYYNYTILCGIFLIFLGTRPYTL